MRALGSDMSRQASKIIFVNLVFTLILLVICDYGVGLFYDRLAPHHGRMNVAILTGEVKADKILSERPHPYLLWENTPEFISEQGIKQTNRQGYRNERDVEPLARGTLRILTLGGSTTYGYLLEHPSDTWSTQLEEKLNSRSAGTEYERVEVINGGLNYGTSAEMLSHYLYRDRYLGAKIVILHTGYNDIGPLLFDDYDPEYAHFRPAWDAIVPNLRTGERTIIRHSNIIKLLYACWLNDAIALPHINKQAKPSNLSEDYYLENVKKNEPIGFERNLELLIKNIIADGATPVLFSDLLPTDEQYQNLKGEAARAAAPVKSMRKATLIGLDKNKEVLRRLSMKYQLLLIEIPPDRIPTQYFLDYIHLSKEGEAIKASTVAALLLKLLRNQ